MNHNYSTDHMSDTTAQSSFYRPDEEEANTSHDFISEVWQRRGVVWHSLLFAILIGCLYLWIVPAKYTATAVVGPAPQQGNAASSSAVSALSSILPLAGLGGSSNTTATPPFDAFLELIVSPRVAADLIKADPKLLPTIFPAEWDKKTKSWHPPNTLFGIAKRSILFVFGLDTWEPPSANRLADYLSENLQITAVNTTSPLQQISISFPSAQFAQSFLKRLMDDADGILTNQALVRTDKQIAYLQGLLATTQAVDYRQTLLALIASQVTTRMTINKGLPYAADQIQPSAVSDLQTIPNPIVALIVAVFVGLFVGTLLALALTVWVPKFLPKTIAQYARGLWNSVAGWLRGPSGKPLSDPLTGHRTH
jgi:Chain length determinant protein